MNEFRENIYFLVSHIHSFHHSKLLVMMESKRQRQVAKQIQKDLGEIFQKDLKQLFNGAFVTITDVKTTPDLAIARVYLSFLLAKYHFLFRCYSILILNKFIFLCF